MRLFSLLLCFTLLTFLACEKSESSPKLTACDEAILLQLGYDAFAGTIPNTECGLHLDKYRFTDGEFYYRPDDNCADMIIQFFNCDGEDICDETGICPGSANAEFISAIGITD